MKNEILKLIKRICKHIFFVIWIIGLSAENKDDIYHIPLKTLTKSHL